MNTVSKSVIGVYAVTCIPTGKVYIGWSSHVPNRLSWHRSHLRNGKHSRREMQADFQKYGEKSFSFVTLAVFETPEAAMQEEAIRITEAFKNGGAYNGMVPTPSVGDTWSSKLEKWRMQMQNNRRHRADEKTLEAHELSEKAIETEKQQEQQRIEEIVNDVMWNLNYRDDQQFLKLIDAFLLLTETTDKALSLEVTGYPKFLFALRRPTSEGCTIRNAKKFHDHILRFMEERDRVLYFPNRKAAA